MSLSIITGITLILSTLIYHSGLVLLLTQAQFGEILKLPLNEQLPIIARHTAAYRLGCLIILIGWVTLGWGLLWVLVFIKNSEGIPLLPMVMPVVIGVSLLLK